MGKKLCRLVVLLSVCVGLTWVHSSSAMATEQPLKEAQEFLSIGKAGPQAIDLQIRTDHAEGQPLKAGDLIVLHVRASREAYIAAIYFSSTGDTVVLFPNKQTPDNHIMPGKEYSLFGEGSGIRLKVSDKMKEGQIVFFASSKPFNLSPLQVPEGQTCITIACSAEKERGVLKQQIEALAEDQGFNKVVLRLKTGGNEGVPLNLMGLPTTVTSDKPESITGVQGVKQQDIKHQGSH
jgi:hypothetical protein